MEHPMTFNRLLPLLLGIALAGSSPAASAAGFKVLEQAIETSTFVVSLPDGDTGSMAVKSCMQCKPVLLRLTPHSRFLAGGAQVTYAEFLALARDSGEQALNIFYDRKSGSITRLLMNGVHRAPPPARKRPRTT
jgi:hypothetical protein